MPILLTRPEEQADVIEQMSTYACLNTLNYVLSQKYPGLINITSLGDPNGYVQISVSGFARLLQLIVMNLRGRNAVDCTVSAERKRLVISLRCSVSTPIRNRMAALARMAGFTLDQSHGAEDEILLYTVISRQENVQLYADAIDRLRYYLYAYLG